MSNMRFMGGISAGYVLLVKSKFYQQNIASLFYRWNNRKIHFTRKILTFTVRVTS